MEAEGMREQHIKRFYQPSRECLVLGLDPGFAHLGWARVELGSSSEHPVAMGHVSTEKSAKKLHVLSTDDNIRRVREISKAVWPLMEGVRVVTAEAMSFPRNSSVAAKMAMAWGVIVDVCTVLDIPLIVATPQQIKVAVCKNKKAEKEDVQAALQHRYGKRLLVQHTEGIKAGDLEHPYDALGSVVAGLDSEVLRMARKMR